MKRILMGAAVLGALVLAGVWIARPNIGRGDTLVAMAKRGASEAEMLKTAVEGHPYRLSADDVIRLKTAGVPSTVLVEMLHNSATTSVVTGK